MRQDYQVARVHMAQPRINTGFSLYNDEEGFDRLNISVVHLLPPSDRY